MTVHRREVVAPVQWAASRDRQPDAVSRLTANESAADAMRSLGRLSVEEPRDAIDMNAIFGWFLRRTLMADRIEVRR